MKYTYTLRHTAPGRVCILTADIQAVVALTGGTACYNQVSSDRLLTDSELASLPLETGVVVDFRDNIEARRQMVEMTRALYPLASDLTLTAMGFNMDYPA